jgi:hypothetical protein
VSVVAVGIYRKLMADNRARRVVSPSVRKNRLRLLTGETQACGHISKLPLQPRCQGDVCTKWFKYDRDKL